MGVFCGFATKYPHMQRVSGVFLGWLRCPKNTTQTIDNSLCGGILNSGPIGLCIQGFHAKKHRPVAMLSLLLPDLQA